MVRHLVFLHERFPFYSIATINIGVSWEIILNLVLYYNPRFQAYSNALVQEPSCHTVHVTAKFRPCLHNNVFN